MGLYEEEIDWDADLFGQIGTSTNPPNIATNNGDETMKALDDANWDMGPSSTGKRNAKSMREQMKQSWGIVNTEEEGKPTADWMPGFGQAGPDEDEPWFTG